VGTRGAHGAADAAAALTLHHVRRGAGDPLVLLHHLGGEWRVFEPVIGPLAEHFDVIVADMPGFGESPSLPASVEPTPEALAGAVAELLDSLGIERAHACGISLGGWVALELARLGRALSVTTLCAAGFWQRPLGPRPGVSPRTLSRLARPVLPLLLAVPALRRRALADSVAHGDRLSRGTAVRLVSTYATAPDYARANGHMRGGVFAGPQGIGVPVTLAWGELDGQVSAPRSLPEGWRQVVLRGCSHLPTLDDPEQTVAVIREGAR
jgi:pimeloyl-ACP methyl ester carboxylesterase